MKLSKIVNFLYEVGTLRKLPRAHQQTLFTQDFSDNISSHSFRVTMIGWHLAILEKANVNKVIKMCLLHDLGEARTGDQNWVHKKYVKVYDEEILNDQIGEFPEMLEITKEYEERVSLESKIAKDADLIDQIMLLKEYELQGNNEASKWLEGKEQGKRLVTKSAKKLVKEIVKQSPHDWWEDIWTEKRR